MLNKAIKAESKVALQFSINIQEIDAHCWKGQKPDKKEETFKSHKK